jgi:hypothetical protein
MVPEGPSLIRALPPGCRIECSQQTALPRPRLERLVSHGMTELDSIDDRDRVDSLSLLPRNVAAAIP